MYFLGIDIGTSSTKSVLFDEHGAAVASAAHGYVFDVDRIGHAEQDPLVWWQAVQSTVSEAIHKSGLKKEQIAGVGLSGQMHGTVALDAQGAVVRKAILHCDVRADQEAAEIRQRFGDRISRITFNPIFPGFQAVTLCWMRKHEPENYARTSVVITPKDYIRYCLTGEIGSEHTDASAVLLYDMKRSAWSDEIFEMLGLPRDIVPAEIHASYEVAGTVTRQAAELCGLAAGTPVVFGGADQAMHSIGNGVYEPGTIMSTIGTSGQVLSVSRQAVYNSELNTHTFRHVKDHAYYGLGAVLFAGTTLNWFRRNFASDCTFEQLSELAAAVPPGSEGLLFLPCMGGERTPYLDPLARGVFDGVTMLHTKAHFARAIMEGVTFAMKTSIEKVASLYGPCDRFVCAGGGVKGLTWAQIQADIYNREILISHIDEQACLGAAIMAAVGANAYATIEDACRAMCDTTMSVLRPDPTNAALYQRIYEKIYTRIYKQNAEIFHEMAAI